MSNYALRVPESLLAYVRQVAEEEHVSMNQFFVTAIAEKVSDIHRNQNVCTAIQRGFQDHFVGGIAQLWTPEVMQMDRFAA